MVFEVPPKLQQPEHRYTKKLEGLVMWSRTAWVHQGLSQGWPETVQGRKQKVYRERWQWLQRHKWLTLAERKRGPGKRKGLDEEEKGGSGGVDATGGYMATKIAEISQLRRVENARRRRRSEPTQDGPTQPTVAVDEAISHLGLWLGNLQRCQYHRYGLDLSHPRWSRPEVGVKKIGFSVSRAFSLLQHVRPQSPVVREDEGFCGLP